MNYAELDKLEANIRRAIEVIQKLAGENLQLKHENHSLLNRIRENERIIQELKSQFQDDGDVVDQVFAYKEKESKIKKKIQQMLDKLETFQQL